MRYNWKMGGVKKRRGVDIVVGENETKEEFDGRKKNAQKRHNAKPSGMHFWDIWSPNGLKKMYGGIPNTGGEKINRQINRKFFLFQLQSCQKKSTL